MSTMVADVSSSRADQLFTETLFRDLPMEEPFAQFYSGAECSGCKTCFPEAGLNHFVQESGEGDHPSIFPVGDKTAVINNAPENGHQLLEFDQWHQDPFRDQNETQCQRRQSLDSALLVPAVAAAAEPPDIPGTYSGELNPHGLCVTSGDFPTTSMSLLRNTLTQSSSPNSDFCKSLQQRRTQIPDFLQQSVSVTQFDQRIGMQVECPMLPATPPVEIAGRSPPFDYPFDDDSGLVGLAYMLGQPATSLAGGTATPDLRGVAEFSDVEPMYAPYMVTPTEPISPLKSSVLSHNTNTQMSMFCGTGQQEKNPYSADFHQMSSKPPMPSDVSQIYVLKDHETDKGLHTHTTPTIDTWSQEDQGSLYDTPGKCTAAQVCIKDEISRKKLPAVRPQRQLGFQKTSQSEMLQCPHPGCDKSFPKLYNLKSHLVCHSNNRPHSCTLCEKAFARKHDLQRHLRTIHSANRPFECEVCYESFPRADALRRHRIVEREIGAGLQKKKSCPAVSKKRLPDSVQQRCQQTHEKPPAAQHFQKRKKSQR